MENNQTQPVSMPRQAPQLVPNGINMPPEVRAAMQGTSVKSIDSPMEKTKYPSELINLPSEGFFYPEGSPLSKGQVDIKYMTAREEDILTSQNLIKKGVVLERLLESLIITPGVKIDDLLIGDKNALFVAARRLAYGDSYGPVEVICRSCNASNKRTINLATIENETFDFSKYVRGQTTFEFILPYSKKKIQYKMLTHKDENGVEAELEHLAKLGKGNAAPEITTRLKHMIVSIDGNSDRSYICKFVDNEFPARDSLAFRTFVRTNAPNIDMEFDFVCDSCSHEERMDVPMGTSFFWPNA